MNQPFPQNRGVCACGATKAPFPFAVRDGLPSTEEGGSDSVGPQDRRLECSEKRAEGVIVFPERDELLTPFAKAVLRDRYLMPSEEGFQELFLRVARAYGSGTEHAQRIYDYMSRLWFMPSTPILSNGGTDRGLPISCFLNEASDSLVGILDLWNENVWLAARGGGIGSYWGNLRGIGELVGGVGKTSGIIPFIHVMDSLTLAISQGSLRRGSAAVYLDVGHPEVEEFIELRRTTGGDPHRKALNLHHGVVIPDAFMHAVAEDRSWALRSPRDGSVHKVVSARHLWVRILTARIETGEPYLLFKDTVNAARPEWHKRAGLEVKTSNLCSEITLPTGLDSLGRERTAVCCLSSVNLEHYREWESHPTFILDIMRFLDNVLEDFIARSSDNMRRASYSAGQERSVGLGVMGFHSFLQENGIPFESVVSKVWNKRIFSHIREKSCEASAILAAERGPCPDAQRYGFNERFSYKTAIAPTASIAIIANTSPAVEPLVANSYTHKTLSGSFTVRNKHLKRLLQEKGCDNEDTWLAVAMDQGSVRNLDCLTQKEKGVFKTAFEIDQQWVVDLAADRSHLVDQAQSLNLFVTPDIHKKKLHELHFGGWEKGIKSFYYCRSMSIQRAETSKTARGDMEGGATREEGGDREMEDPAGGEQGGCLWCQ